MNASNGFYTRGGRLTCEAAKHDHRKRIALAEIRDGQVWNSFAEGEFAPAFPDDWRYPRAGDALREALKAAEHDARVNTHMGCVSHIAVIAFPIAIDGPTRVVARFPVP